MQKITLIYNKIMNKLQNLCMKLRVIELHLTVILAFVSLYVWYLYGINYAIYTMGWAILFGMPVDAFTVNYIKTLGEENEEA